jgi:DNA ligase-1
MAHGAGIGAVNSMSQIAPAHEGRELGIGDATLIKALAEATGRKEQAIKDDYNEEGDLGVVAMASRSKQKTMFQPAPLSVRPTPPLITSPIPAP